MKMLKNFKNPGINHVRAGVRTVKVRYNLLVLTRCAKNKEMKNRKYTYERVKGGEQQPSQGVLEQERSAPRGRPFAAAGKRVVVRPGRRRPRSPPRTPGVSVSSYAVLRRRHACSCATPCPPDACPSHVAAHRRCAAMPSAVGCCAGPRTCARPLP